MKYSFLNSKYSISISLNFKKNYKKIRKQHKDINKLIEVLKLIFQTFNNLNLNELKEMMNKLDLSNYSIVRHINKSVDI